MTYPWDDNRRFNSYSNYFRRTSGGRMQKISVDGGFTCPNRDGNISHGGCTFCCNDAFNPSYCQPSKSIKQQIDEGIEFHTRRYRHAERYLAYFQAFSNTYKPIDQLRKLYYEALENPKVAGLVVGTRPDLVNEEVLRLLAEISKSHYVMLELGIESVYDETLTRVNRGHDFKTSVKAVNMAHEVGIACGGHLILGLPGESREMMLKTADTISALPLTTIKLHQLQIFKNTAMGREYSENPSSFRLFTLDEYIEFVIDFAERLNPNIVIERFAGEVPPRYLLSESWGNIRYDKVLTRIEKRLAERNTFQGRLFKA